MCVCVCHRWVLKVWDICFLSFFKIFCTVRQILVVRTFFCDFDGSKCFWRRLKVPWNAYETLIQLILGSGAWSPPQAHLAFRFFTIYRKFCDPSLKNAVPPKKCRYLTPDPPQKKVNGAYFFFKLAHFYFFLQLKLKWCEFLSAKISYSAIIWIFWIWTPIALLT